MARIILEPGEEMTFSSNLAGIINGYADSIEHVTIADDSTVTFDATFNGGGDIIEFAGEASDFQVSIDGATVVLTSADDGISVRIPIGEATEIVFEDGEPLTLQVNQEGQPVLGEQVITQTPTTIDADTALAKALAGLDLTSAEAIAAQAPAEAYDFVMQMSAAPRHAPQEIVDTSAQFA